MKYACHDPFNYSLVDLLCCVCQLSRKWVGSMEQRLPDWSRIPLREDAGCILHDCQIMVSTADALAPGVHASMLVTRICRFMQGHVVDASFCNVYSCEIQNMISCTNLQCSTMNHVLYFA